MTKCFIVLAALALSGCGASPRCLSTDARGVAEALQPKQQLRTMLETVSQRTQTFAMAKQRDGSKAQQRLSEAVDAAVERHGAEWERNVISGWSELAPAELEEVCTALKERDQASYTRFAERIGARVQSLNQPLLNRAGAEVLGAVWSPDD